MKNRKRMSEKEIEEYKVFREYRKNSRKTQKKEDTLRNRK